MANPNCSTDSVGSTILQVSAMTAPHPATISHLSVFEAGMRVRSYGLARYRIMNVYTISIMVLVAGSAVSPFATLTAVS